MNAFVTKSNLISAQIQVTDSPSHFRPGFSALKEVIYCVPILLLFVNAAAGSAHARTCVLRC